MGLQGQVWRPGETLGARASRPRSRACARRALSLALSHEGRGDLAPRLLYHISLISSATRSPIIIVVTLVLARMQSGMMEASATRKPSSP